VAVPARVPHSWLDDAETVSTAVKAGGRRAKHYRREVTMAKRKKNKHTPRLRPSNKPDARVVDGTYALSTLLKGDLDGRLAIAKARDEFEADIIDYSVGPSWIVGGNWQYAYSLP
jgi:hypothetical protein